MSYSIGRELDELKKKERIAALNAQWYLDIEAHYEERINFLKALLKDNKGLPSNWDQIRDRKVDHDPELFPSKVPPDWKLE